jgi:hypothetical protein
MSGDSRYVITPAGRTTLLAGPLGAVLMLATAHGLRVPGPA